MIIFVIFAIPQLSAEILARNAKRKLLSPD